MPLSAADLLQPNGDIELSWFPGRTLEDVTVLLSAYLADAYGVRIPATLTPVEADAAARAWAMARAARNVAMRLSNTPATVTVQGEGAQSITGEQIRTFTTMAAKYEAEFAVFTPEEVEQTEAPGGSVANDYRW